jgi:hypothetical protein
MLINEFDNTQNLNKKIMAARKDLQYLSPNAVNDDPVNQPRFLTRSSTLWSSY